MMKKIVLFIILALSILGLAWTDDLYQNTDEQLLIAKSNDTQVETKDILFIHFKDMKDHRDEINNLLEEADIDRRVIGPRELSSKKTIEEIKAFYTGHELLDIKLVSAHGISYILELDRKERKKHPKIIYNIEKTFPNAVLAGLPYLNYQIGLQTLDIKKKILPVLIVISFLLTLFFTRNLFTSFVLFVFPFSAIPTSLVLLKLIYGEANLLSNLAPLISFVVILCLNFHLYYSSLIFKSYGELVQYKLKPIVFMLFTTILGVFSLYTSSVPAIKIFAFICGLSLTLSSVLTLGFFRSVSDYYLNSNQRSIRFNLVPPKIPKIPIILSLLLPIIIFTLVKSGLTVQIEALYFFNKNHKVVTSTKFIEKNIIGTPILDIEIKDFDLSEKYEKAQLIDNVEMSIKKVFGKDSLILSKIQSIKNANYIYTGDKTLPKFKISALALLSKSPSFADQEVYTIKVLSYSIDTEAYFKKLVRVKKNLKEFGVNYKFHGNYFNLMHSQSSIIKTLLRSFGISLFLISIIIGIYFKRFKDFVVFLVVNLIPPLLTLILFAIFDMSLNLATIMTFSVSFGLIVDSTIHVIHGNEANLNSIQKSESIFMPILVSTLILLIGFVSFTMHNFLPIRQFGFSLVLTIFFGFIYDFYILPNIKLS